MSRYRNLITVIGIFLVGLPFIGECSWQSNSCIQKENCYELSSGYTVPYCVSYGIDNAYQCNISSLVNDLSSNLRSQDFTTRDLISQYCDALLGDQSKGRIYYSKPSIQEGEDGRDWSQTFDSHQSLFVHLLCSSTVDKKSPLDMSELFLNGDINRLLKLQQLSDGKDKCSSSSGNSLNECDMSLYATEIFSAIMSDIFKIKYAQIFQIDSAENFKNRKERALAFLGGYFEVTDESFIKNFPETVDVIDSNQKYYKKVLESLRLFDNAKLVKKAEDSKCPVTGNLVGMDFIACALHGSQGKGISLSPSFLTLFYNEIMSYRIFVSYYQDWIEIKVNTNDNLSSDEKEILESKAEDFKSYTDLQIEAANQTLHNFEELNMTYPLHIGLLMYQEKIKTFRNKNLSPIVTMFYSLSEKLQNVQIPKN